MFYLVECAESLNFGAVVTGRDEKVQRFRKLDILLLVLANVELKRGSVRNVLRR